MYYGSVQAIDTAYAGSAGAGGGVYNLWHHCSPQVINRVFDGNQATERGGAMRNKQQATPTLINCTLYGKVAGLQGGDIHNETSANAVLTNGILWGNSVGGATNEAAQVTSVSSSPVVTCCCIQGLAGHNNIGTNPSLVDPDGPDNNAAIWQDNNYHLADNSPCINAGDPATVYAERVDMDAEPRRRGVRVDIGADEVRNPQSVHNPAPDRWYSHAQTALDDANSGDRIVINPDTFYQNVTIKTKVRLRSTNPTNPASSRPRGSIDRGVLIGYIAKY